MRSKKSEYEGRSNYRYGFQGQEKDDEIKGIGNSLNYKYRMHDPRVGRFFAIDPLFKKYPYNSTYAFSENVVINAVELEGLEKYFTNDGDYLGQVGDDNSERIMGNIFSGTEEAKNVTNAIKLVNEISSKVNKDLENKPGGTGSEYLRNERVKKLLKVHDKLESELFNGSENKLVYKFKKVFNIEIGTSQYWSDGPSNFTSKDLGDGKIAFQLSDMDLFLLVDFYKPSAFNNSQIKIYKTDNDFATNLYKIMMKARKIVKAVEKTSIVTDVMIKHFIDEGFNYQCEIFDKDGTAHGGGYFGDYRNDKEAEKARQKYLKEHPNDSIIIHRYHD